MQKKPKSELEGAELRHSSLIEKRNEYNDKAKEFAESRNVLNAEKRRILDETKEMREKRHELVVMMRKHKTRRNAYQDKAKALIAQKRSKKKGIPGSVKKEIETTKADLKYADIKQQTVPMSLHKENELLDTIKEKLKNLERLESLKEEEDKIFAEVQKVDASITELFEMADEEHKKVVKLSKEINKIHDTISTSMKSLTHLTIESNKNHEGFLAMKEKANHYHEKAQEMRQKLMAIRNEKRDEARAGRKAIKDHNIQVKKTMDSDKSKDKAAKKALEELLKKGKVEI